MNAKDNHQRVSDLPTLVLQQSELRTSAAHTSDRKLIAEISYILCRKKFQRNVVFATMTFRIISGDELGFTHAAQKVVSSCGAFNCRPRSLVGRRHHCGH